METSILIPENYPLLPEDVNNLDQFDFESILALATSDNSASPLTPPSSDEPELPPFEADPSLSSLVPLIDLPELQQPTSLAPNLLKRHEPTSPDHSSQSESSSVTKSKRSKRAATDVSDVAPILLLTDEDLLKHNSETFDEHVATVQRVRALTDAERNLVKLQRRKIKNRESAAKSRKERQYSFESVLQELQVIKAQNQQLLHENQQLRQRVNAFESASKVTPSTLVDNLRQKFSLGKPMTPSNAKAVGCLLIVLFAFGFFFNQSIGLNGPKIPLLETSNGLLPRFSRSQSPALPENFSQSRFAGQSKSLARALDHNPNLNNERQPQSPSSPLPRHNEDASFAKQNAAREPSSFSQQNGRLQFGGAVSSSRFWGGQPRGGRILKNDDGMTPLHSWPAAAGAGRRLLDLSNGSQLETLNEKDDTPPRVIAGEFFKTERPAEFSSQDSQLHQQKPLAKLNSNVTFLMCSDVNRLIPQIPSEAENMFRGDPFLVLFVPPTDEKGQPLQNAESAVQLTCRVVDVQMAPIVPTETTMSAPNANETAIDEASLSLPVSINPSPVFSL